jgi:hypothetical protein
MVFEADSLFALQQSLRTLTTDPSSYGALVQGTLGVRHKLYERERSYRTQLYSALLSLKV